jgi:hypothetical protein
MEFSGGFPPLQILKPEDLKNKPNPQTQLKGVFSDNTVFIRNASEEKREGLRSIRRLE